MKNDSTYARRRDLGTNGVINNFITRVSNNVYQSFNDWFYTFYYRWENVYQWFTLVSEFITNIYNNNYVGSIISTKHTLTVAEVNTMGSQHMLVAGIPGSIYSVVEAHITIRPLGGQVIGGDQVIGLYVNNWLNHQLAIVDVQSNSMKTFKMTPQASSGVNMPDGYGIYLMFGGGQNPSGTPNVEIDVYFTYQIIELDPSYLSNN